MIIQQNGIVQSWATSLRQKNFRYLLLTGLFILSIILSFFAPFFSHIQKINGAILHDWVLQKIPASDVSIFVFLFIWSSAFLFVIASLKHPKLLLNFLWAYIFLSLLRFLTISLVPLDPPPNLLPLKDPLSNYFYGDTYITKDLFFSGHTSTLFLISLSINSRKKKVFCLISSLFVGILVLVQHVHYTIDVIFAFPMSYLCYFASVRLTRRLLL